jgi:hypothetical protein
VMKSNEHNNHILLLFMCPLACHMVAVALLQLCNSNSTPLPDHTPPYAHLQSAAVLH